MIQYQMTQAIIFAAQFALILWPHNQVVERFDWDAQIALDRDRLKGLISLDFGLERLTPEQAHDFYEIVSERYERGATLSPATGTWQHGSAL